MADVLDELLELEVVLEDELDEDVVEEEEEELVEEDDELRLEELVVVLELVEGDELELEVVGVVTYVLVEEELVVEEISLEESERLDEVSDDVRLEDCVLLVVVVPVV